MTTLTPSQRAWLCLFLAALAVARSVEGRPHSQAKQQAIRRWRRLHAEAREHLEGSEVVPVLRMVAGQPGRTWEERAGRLLGQ